MVDNDKIIKNESNEIEFEIKEEGGKYVVWARKRGQDPPRNIHRIDTFDTLEEARRFKKAQK